MKVIARIGGGIVLHLDGKEYKISTDIARNLMHLGIEIRYEYGGKR